MTQLESTILQYEKDFFNAKFCNSIDNLESRLCLEFYEYGASGEIYRRDDVIDFLLNMKKDRDICIYNFSITILNDDIILANYLSHDRGVNLYSLRTSIWRKEEEYWKMLFHQGTSCNYKTKIDCR